MLTQLLVLRRSFAYVLQEAMASAQKVFFSSQSTTLQKYTSVPETNREHNGQ